MIALQDDFNPQKVEKKPELKSSSAPIRGRMQALLQKLQGIQQTRKQRKVDSVALNQLMQLDDTLLKDMGIERSELYAVRTGTLSFEALIKRDIAHVRDNAYYSQLPQKPPK